MMSVVRISELYAGKRNFVFLGEAGSGKPQIAINFAFALVREQSCAVQLFDMDQTKTGFRARDFAQQLNAEGISLRWQPQFFDAPTVVSGVDESLRDSGCFTLLDVGGGHYGSHMIGQFSQSLHGKDTEVIYILNPYRPWSRRTEDINATMAHITASCALSIDSFIFNPNIGAETSPELILTGLRELRALMPEQPAKLVTIESALCGSVMSQLDVPILPIKLSSYGEWF